VNKLHFTFGPVQGFVSQARRTMDLFSGSFLLSYLAAIAIKAIQDAGGAIVFPEVVKDPLLQGVNGGEKRFIEVGSLPNRFEASVTQEKTEDIARTAARALEDAWNNLAGEVKKLLDKEVCKLINNEFSKIWDRQIKNFWEINWVVGDQPRLLDVRKNIRNFCQLQEPGEKCTQCGERQVLGNAAKADKKEVRRYWNRFSKKVNGNHALTFRPDGAERLCAVCTVKRLVSVKQPYRWKVPEHYPSVSTMATLTWKEVVIKKSQEHKDILKEVEKYVQVMEEAKLPFSDLINAFPHWKELVERDEFGVIEKFLRLDGEWLFKESFVKSEFPGKKDDLTIAKARKAAADFAKTMKEKWQIEKPSAFFALLVMDGDRMGKLLSGFTHDSAKISQALVDFSIEEVPKIIQGYHGKLIYAGGDDVLALLPVDKALPCAKTIAKAYKNAFDKRTPLEIQEKATISAGIVYAHHKTPLGVLLKDAHELLNSVAKEETGRDAFALRVWKRNGPILTYSRKWKDIIHLEQLRKDFKNYPNRFLYRFRDLSLLKEITWGNDDLQSILTAALLKSREPKLDRAKAEELARIFYMVISSQEKEQKRLNLDGPLFIRFISQEVPYADIIGTS
jgi:CRISPR-associated protein Cmr2